MKIKVQEGVAVNFRGIYKPREMPPGGRGATPPLHYIYPMLPTPPLEEVPMLSAHLECSNTLKKIESVSI